MKSLLRFLPAAALACLMAATALRAASPCDTIKDPENRARCLYAKKHYNEALFAMHGVVGSDSSSFDKSRLYLALLMACDDKPGLKRFLPGFQRRFARFDEGAVLCARGYGQAGEWDKAAAILEKAYAQGNAFEYLSELLSVSMKAEKYDYAGSIVETILQKDSAYAEAHHAAGRIVMNKSIIRQIKEKKSTEAVLREALVHFRKACRFDNTNSQYFSDVGETYRKLGLPDSAATAYLRAVALNGRNLKLLLELGTLLAELRRHEEALVIFEKALLQDSMNVDLLLKIEESHKRLGTYEGYFITGQERLANALPDTLSIRYNLAVEYARRRMPEKAKAAYLKVLAREASYQEANRGLAAIYLLQDSCLPAIPYLERQAALSRGEYVDLLNLGQCCLKTGDTAKAIQSFEKVLAINPNHGQTATMLGTWYYNLKQYDRSLAALRDGPVYTDSLGLFRMRGGALFHLKRDPARAIESLLKCVDTREDDESLHAMLAGLYEQAGEKRKAVKEYKRCVKKFPDSQNTDYYKSRIKELD